MNTIGRLLMIFVRTFAFALAAGLIKLAAVGLQKWTETSVETKPNPPKQPQRKGKDKKMK